MNSENKVRLSFLFSGLVLAVSVGVSGSAIFTLISNYQSVLESQQEALKTERIDSGLKQAEISEKTFLITGKRRDLETYYANKEEVELSLKTLNLPKLKKKASEMGEVLDKEIQLRDEEGLTAAIQVLLQGKTKSLQEEIQREVDLLKESQRVDISAKVEQAKEKADGAILALVGLTLTLLLLFVFAAWVIQRDLKLLTEARALADRASKEKSLFLASMSHEIRTPLNAVVGGVNLIQKTKLSEDQEKLAHVVQSASRSLLSIINNILDFSKIEAGKMQLDVTEFSLSKLCQESVELFSFQAGEKKINLKFEWNASENLTVQGDSTKLRQVLINLIGNSIKFTEKGTVGLRVVEAPSVSGKVEYQFEVFDTGIGISKDNLSRMFKQFSQAEASIQRNFGGTGLGLAISQDLVRLMGGEIKIRSEIDKGSNFSFELSLEKVDAIEVEKPKEVGGDRSRKSILVAEDSKLNQVVISATLKSMGYKAKIVGNGKEVLEALEKESYDLIVLDCNMPVMDGYVTAENIRGQQKSIPIIALTANAISEEYERCFKVGMNDYLMKPFDENLLERTLDKWLFLNGGTSVTQV